jgi:hypothetical protein
VLGESGAFKALTLDLAEELGLPLADLHDADSPELRAALPVFVPVSNPLDITAQGLSQPVIYTNTLNALLADDRIGAVVAGIIQGDPVTAQIKVPAILAALHAAHKPVVFAGLDEGADIPAHHIAALRAAGVTWLPSTERACRALARLAAPPRAIWPMPRPTGSPSRRWMMKSASSPNIARRRCSPPRPALPARRFCSQRRRRRRRRQHRRLPRRHEGPGRRTQPQERCGRGHPEPCRRSRRARRMDADPRQCRGL